MLKFNLFEVLNVGNNKFRTCLNFIIFFSKLLINFIILSEFLQFIFNIKNRHIKIYTDDANIDLDKF